MDIAHERALRRELETIAADFDRWHAGNLDTFALSERLHKYDRGAGLQLWKIFSDLRDSTLGSVVARTVAEGWLAESELPGEALDALGPLIAHMREMLAEVPETACSRAPEIYNNA